MSPNEKLSYKESKVSRAKINEGAEQEKDIIILSRDYFDDIEAFPNPLIGATVSHCLYGDGEIIESNAYYIIVKFEKRTAKFLYPEAVGEFLTINNQRLQKNALLHKKLKKRNEYKRGYGYKLDPIEYTPRFIKIETELEELIRSEIGNGGYLGFCHLYWMTKKRILKERYGINWKSPAELNPRIIFD